MSDTVEGAGHAGGWRPGGGLGHDQQRSTDAAIAVLTERMHNLANTVTGMRGEQRHEFEKLAQALEADRREQRHADEQRFTKIETAATDAAKDLKVTLEKMNADIDKRLDEKAGKRAETIVYSACGVILMAVMAALVATILKTSANDPPAPPSPPIRLEAPKS